MNSMQQLAEEVDGLQYPLYIPKNLIAKAKNERLVILYGSSDDLMEFEGAILDEVGIGDGGKVTIGPNGLVPEWEDLNKDNPKIVKDYLENQDKNNTITAIWDDKGVPWTYKTTIPHYQFAVLEDDDVYCLGLVFSLDDLHGKAKIQVKTTAPVVKNDQLRALVNEANRLSGEITSFTKVSGMRFFMDVTYTGKEVAYLASASKDHPILCSERQMNIHVSSLENTLDEITEKHKVQETKIAFEKKIATMDKSDMAFFKEHYSFR